MPWIKTFFGHQLDAGARVAAFYTILFSFLMAARGFWYLKQINDWKDTYNDHDKMMYEFQRFESIHKTENKEKTLFPIALSFVCFGILFFFASILLFHSGLKKNNKCVWPWIITIGIGIGYFFVQLIYYGFIANSSFSEIEAVVGLILICITVYFYVIVCSYKQWVANSLTGTSITQDFVLEPSLATRPTINEYVERPPSYFNLEPLVTNEEPICPQLNNENLSHHDPPPQYSDISNC